MYCGRSDDMLKVSGAFIVAKDASVALARELQECAKARLEPYKYPRQVVLLDALPRTHLGQIDRAALARRAVHRVG